jgi:hypothetical protein
MKAKKWNQFFKNKTSFYFDAEQACDLSIVDTIIDNDKPEFTFVFEEEDEDEED